LSRILAAHLKNNSAPLSPSSFEEVKGKGIVSTVHNQKVAVGSASFTQAPKIENAEIKGYGSVVHIAINEIYKGYYFIESRYREGLWNTLAELKKDKSIYLLSGDQEDENPKLETSFASNRTFHQSPADKKEFILNLRSQGATMMIGDGINDGVALKVSDVGVAISDNVNSFYPSAHVILDGQMFNELPRILRYSKKVLTIIYACLGLSFSYNIVGMYFACTLRVTPLFAAVLMPISSVTVVSLAVGGTYIAYRRTFKTT
jgi:Cu+-exporting ATPase